jgi:hypothetical protein
VTGYRLKPRALRTGGTSRRVSGSSVLTHTAGLELAVASGWNAAAASASARGRLDNG